LAEKKDISKTFNDTRQTNINYDINVTNVDLLMIQ